MKRIAIIGLPGSGKSTFALALGKRLQLPIYHLDKYIFDGKNKRNKDEFLEIKQMLVDQESWIIEGCSFSTIEMRFARADTVFYFNLSRFLCITRIVKRFFTNSIEDTGCLKGINWAILKYLWDFDRSKSDKIEQLKKKYPKVNFLVFKQSEQANQFLKTLKLN